MPAKVLISLNKQGPANRDAAPDEGRSSAAKWRKRWRFAGDVRLLNLQNAGILRRFSAGKPNVRDLPLQAFWVVLAIGILLTGAIR